jgi:hypothetical protein
MSYVPLHYYTYYSAIYYYTYYATEMEPKHTGSLQST